jgi:hypothetical protein
MSMRFHPPLLSLLLAVAPLWVAQGCSGDNSSSGEADAESDAEPPEEDEDSGTEPQDAGGRRDAGDAGRADAGRRDAAADADVDATPDANMDASDDAGDGGGSMDTGSALDSSDAADDAAGGDAQPDADPPDAAEAGSEAGSEAGQPDAAVCPQCPGERCLPDGTCVECSEQLPCADAALACELTSHTCVECLPSNDTCPAGEYCTTGFECVRGCKANGGGCASGRCDANHECQQCLEDLECGSDRVCGTFSCGVGCGFPDDPPCGAGTECCAAQCVDTKRDIEHCGGCGVACAGTQFCGVSGCETVALGKLCSLPTLTVVLSGQSADQAESELLIDALEASCAPAPTISSVLQTESLLLNPVTGQPVAGGNQLLVTLGSGYANNLVRYLETQRIAPVYQFYMDGPDPFFEYRRSSNDQVLVHGLRSAETADHGHFLVQIVREPESGSLTVLAYGFWAEGTAAARWFLANQVLPALSTYTDTWYIYEWANNATPGPDAGDTFTRVDSGT